MSSFLSRLRRHKLLLAFLPALIFLFCSVFYYEINHSFVAFCDTVFRNEITENTLNLHYTLENPEILNLSDPDVSFGSMNPEVLADSFSQQNIYLEKLFKFPKDWLSTKNRLTYDILTSAFSLQAEGEKYLLYDEPLGPSLGTQAQLPVLLAEYSFHNKKDIEKLLKDKNAKKVLIEEDDPLIQQLVSTFSNQKLAQTIDATNKLIQYMSEIDKLRNKKDK